MFGKPHILTSSDGWITPVARWCATAEEREDALNRYQSSRIVRELQRGAARHDLISLYEVATGMELHRPRHADDHALVAAIEDALSSGKLLLVPAWTPGARGDTKARATRAVDATEDGRLVAAVLGERRSLE